MVRVKLNGMAEQLQKITEKTPQNQLLLTFKILHNNCNLCFC